MKHAAECPSCNWEFGTSIEAAQAGLVCPKCGIGFVPESLKEYRDDPKPLPPAEPASQDPKISREEQLTKESRYRAENLSGVAGNLMVLGWAVFVVSILVAVGLNSEAWIAWAIVGGAFWVAMTFFFLAQFYHIRAALERR